MAEDSELWDIICDGPYVPTKVLEELLFSMTKTSKEYTDANKKAVEKNFRAKKILVCRIGPEEYNRISAYDTAEEIWEALQTTHEGTTQDDESIQDMYTRFTSIINELHSLGETIPRNKLVRKILTILPSPWEIKVNAITESKDLQELTTEELIGNLKAYEMKRKIDSERREPKKEKNLVLKADSNDSSDEDVDMTYLTKRFQKMDRRNGEMLKGGSSNKPKNYDLCRKCGKPGHFIKRFPLLKQEFSKNNSEKAAKRNPVPFKDFKRKRSADNVMKQALAAWGDSSGESEDETNAGDSSMMEVEGEEKEFDSTFALMARDVQRNLKSYSPKKLMSLASLLIDTYHSLVEDRDSLSVELGKVEQTRDDLVDVVIDHKETIEKFHEERNDFLGVIADLRETIDRPGTKSKSRNSRKGKEIASMEHIRLENELKDVRTRMCAEIEKNKNLQADLERVKYDLEKFLKWTWSSETTTDIYTNNGGNRQEIGFQRENTPYNSHSK
ncbi:uncharacterized protein [Nicotiana sylvestris]|uniref:uncharacterized protein n=1 Tax=Nicotiana sylvestris TaxID=4096 RepID=UPI00388C6FD8